MLTKADIEHFALHGYVVKRRVVEPDVLAKAADTVWRSLPPNMSRDDPTTWTDSVLDCRGDLSISERFGLVKLRSEIRQFKEINDITINNETLCNYVAQLFGPENVGPHKVPRGIYPIFPTPEHDGVEVNAHIDFTPMHFLMTIGVYVEDVPEGGGGLNVWPGSHRTLHHLARTTGCDIEDMAVPKFQAAFEAWNRTSPVTIPGQAGDVILFHYRLAHAPSLNVLPDHVRLAAYFNVYAKDQDPRPPSALWERWRGVSAIQSDAIRRSETFLPAPTPDQFSPSRQHRLDEGAWPGFSTMLRRTTLRAAASRNEGSLLAAESRA